MRNRKSGFTLLELIIVVIVIGILASIALPRYIRVAEKGRIAEALTMLGSLRSAQLRYVAQHGVYAASVGDLDVNFQTPRYFTNPLGAPDITDTGNEASIVCSLDRNTVDNPVGVYTIQMEASGQVVGVPTIFQ